jgi:hypothetical protein
MLQKLADHIAAARANAAEAERANQPDLARAWRHVISSYEFV